MSILNKHIKLSRNQRGVTLVELMIAVTISSIVMIGIGSVYTSSKRSFKLQEEFSRLQENGRFAINHITRFVRSAGYSGCASGLDSIESILNPTTDGIWEFATGIEGYDYIGTEPGQLVTLSATPTATTDTAGNHDNWKADTTPVSLPDPAGTDNDLLGHTFSPIANTDIIVARTSDGSGIEVSQPSASGQVFITCAAANSHTCPDDVDGNAVPDGYCGLCEGDAVLVSNCQKAAAFQITNTQAVGAGDDQVNIVHSAGGSNPGNSTPILPIVLSTGDEVMKVSTKVFYVGMGTTGPSLFMRQGAADAIELVEGVENMQVLYGEDTDATPDNIPNRYVAATDVIDFANVVAVRVSILLRSVKQLPWRTDKNETYLLGGMDNDTAVRVKSPTDKRLRKVMSTTIKVRNRAFSL